MTIIEIVGPSGAGKTTIRKTMSDQSPHVIDGFNGVMTCCSREFTTPLIELWPKPVQIRYWRKFLVPRLSSKFLDSNPYLECVNEKTIELSPGERTEFFLDREMARRQLFENGKLGSEIMFVDDGLLQFYSVLIENDVIDEESINYLPLPDILILVKASPEVCLERQEERNRGRASAFIGEKRTEAIDRLKAIQTATFELADMAKEENINIIKKNTEGDINKICAEITHEINKSTSGQ